MPSSSGPRRPRQLMDMAMLSILVLLALYQLPSTTLASPLTKTDVDFVVGAAVANDTNGLSSGQAGGATAASAAQVVGSSIDTGAGGDRAAPTSPEGFTKLLAPFFFGALINLMVGGALATQAWLYFERFGRTGSDQRLLQILVGVLITMSLASNGAVIHRLYEIHVAKFGNFAYPLLTIGKDTAVVYVLNAIMAGLCQIYYLHRVIGAVANEWRLRVLIPLVPLISFTFAGGIANGVLALQAGSLASIRGDALSSIRPNSAAFRWSVSFATFLSCSALIDVSLCALLTFQLVRLRTSFIGTRLAIARLLLLSGQTCFITASFAVCSMALFLTRPQTPDYFITWLPFGQLEAISLVITLMARPSIAAEMNKHDVRKESRLKELESSPVTIVRPVMRRIIMRESRERPQADASQISVITHIAERDDGGDEGGDETSRAVRSRYAPSTISEETRASRTLGQSSSEAMSTQAPFSLMTSSSKGSSTKGIAPSTKAPSFSTGLKVIEGGDAPAVPSPSLSLPVSNSNLEAPPPAAMDDAASSVVLRTISNFAMDLPPSPPSPLGEPPEIPSARPPRRLPSLHEDTSLSLHSSEGTV